MTLRRVVFWGRQHTWASLFIKWQPPLDWTAMADQQRRHWNEQTIQDFWVGTSSYQDEHTADLSYSLASRDAMRASHQAMADQPAEAPPS